MAWYLYSYSQSALHCVLQEDWGRMILLSKVYSLVGERGPHAPPGFLKCCYIFWMLNICIWPYGVSPLRHLMRKGFLALIYPPTPSGLAQNGKSLIICLLLDVEWWFWCLWVYFHRQGIHFYKQKMIWLTYSTENPRWPPNSFLKASPVRNKANRPRTNCSRFFCGMYFSFIP